MGAPYLLGIDLGTTTCRAAVFDLRGRQIGASSLETAARYPRPTWAEVDPRVWWEGTVRVLRQTLGAAGVDPRAIAGVGLTGLMHAPVLVDAAGEAVTPAMLWMDQRCAPQSARLERAAPAGRFGTSLSAAKLRWLADEQPQALARAAHLLLPKDFLRLRLTGAVATDPSDAGGTGLYRRQDGAWDREAVDLCGVPRRLLPPVRPSWSLAGCVTPAAARATGLAPGTPVAVGGADTYCTRLGAGGLAPGEACLYVGTAAWVAVTAEPPRGEPPRGELRAGRRGRGAPLGARSCAVRGHRHHRSRPALGPRPDRPPWAAPGGPGDAPGSDPQGDPQGAVSASYDALVEAAAGVPPGAEGLFFLPHLMGERGPRPDPLARGALVGLTLLHGRGHVVRAVLEGTAFQIRRLLEERLGEARLREGTAPRCGAPWSAGAGPAATCGCASWPTSRPCPCASRPWWRPASWGRRSWVGSPPGRTPWRGARRDGGPGAPRRPRPWRRRPLRGPLRALPRPGRPPQPLVSAPGRPGLTARTGRTRPSARTRPTGKARRAMKAALFYGGRDIRVETLPDPQPGPGEVLVRVRAAGICGSDLHGYRRPAPSRRTGEARRGDGRTATSWRGWSPPSGRG